MSEKYDVIIVGASFAGLSCATELAENGLRVLILERKEEPGQAIHTTGIIVKEAAQELSIPDQLTHSINQVRLYSPSLRYIDLHSQDYFFLATDTPNMMRHLAYIAENKGVQIRYGIPYTHGEQNSDGSISIPDLKLHCTFLIGADGPRSSVAKDFNLGENKRFLLGVEAEFSSAKLPSDNAFYCFLNQELARGYLGWVVPGINIVQVGLATIMPLKPDIDVFIDHIKSEFSLNRGNIIARRGGLIPVGGTVAPLSRGNVILLGDAAGTVSPLSGGGIHTAYYLGKQLAKLIVNHLENSAAHPKTFITREYPKFRFKHAMRFVFESYTPNWLLDLMIGNVLFKFIARVVFFSKKRLPKT